MGIYAGRYQPNGCGLTEYTQAILLQRTGRSSTGGADIMPVIMVLRTRTVSTGLSHLLHRYFIETTPL